MACKFIPNHQINSLAEKYRRIINDNNFKVLVVISDETSETVGMATGKIIHPGMFIHKITGKLMMCGLMKNTGIGDFARDQI
ncbi:MAG TPA: hypothetical protein DDX29_10825 [Clostridiales bacterium]|nr:hypothetical protein [Clostridiales bacterium]